MHENIRLRKAVFANVRGLWCRIWEDCGVWARLVHLATRVPHYTELHRIANFAGNLEKLKVAYASGNDELRQKLSTQFDAIIDQITMPNGVGKQTHSNRLVSSISAVLSAIQLPHVEIRVLDLPASAGTASLDNLALLEERYRVTSYVLGDLYHAILYDETRRCIFDEHGNLLQVGFKWLFFSVYRVGTLSERYKAKNQFFALPHDVMAWYLRKRYRFKSGAAYRRLLVVHPEVERIVGQGLCRLEEMDVFQPISDGYDVIISFHLLQQGYFPPEIIKKGITNLGAALSEGGLLIMGSENSYLALQKQGDALITRLHQGSL
jgi:hypothetical protein